ncbi:MAG: DUF1573 domain-containing protein [Spirochaetales bacterium]|nr:DUF1573 domain-containing protein [Spirochaetales bacterium]
MIEGEDVSYAFVFTNTGTHDVTLTRVQPACVCTLVTDWDKTVAPGKKGKILVVFKTPSINGEVTKVIFVTTDIPEQNSIQLTLKGNVLIPVEIVPRNTWLGDVDNHTKQLSGSFKIINNTDKPLKITEVIPPDIDITFILTTIEENARYSLDYIIFPPFNGEGTVGNLFTVKTNIKGNESLSLKFFYYKKPLL